MNVLEVFTGNPMNSPVGQRIDKATDGALDGEDWALNMEICDIINETDEGPKEAVRALRKKIMNSAGKDWRSISYCLVVLETCVKNCGKRFHIQVANKDFLHELVKVISPKYEPTVLVQEKILSLIQTWADAFRGSPELKAVEQVYQELKTKGLEFPATDLDQMAPIHTPKSTVESPARSQSTNSSLPSQHHPSRAPAPSTHVAPSMMTGTTMATSSAPSADQMSKLRADIDIVQGNCRVFNEMLNVATPGSSDITQETTDLMRELNRTCRQMQQRIVILIEQLADEQVTEVLLRVNDDLNNAFLRYDRLERYLSMSTASKSAAAPHMSAPAPAKTASGLPATAAAAKPDQALIDFGSNEPSPPPAVSASALEAHMVNVNLSGNISSIRDVPTHTDTKPDTDEFDMFAQSRQYDATKHSAAASYSFQTEQQATGSIGSAAAGRSNPYAAEEPSATSSEFDQFLEERVAAGERLPDRKPDDGSRQPPPRSAARQMHKDDSENALFAL